MADYVSRVRVTIDGQEESNFKSFKEGEEEYARAVNLMNKSGFTDVTTRFGFDLDYVTPTAAARDFSKIRSSTVSVELDGGGKVIYSRVRALKKAERTFDGENEAVCTVTFGAEDRKVE